MPIKNVLSLTYNKAKNFFLQEENYSNILLPNYFSFQKLIDKINTKVSDKDIKNFYINAKKNPPSNYDNVNYVIYNNKNGNYA